MLQLQPSLDTDTAVVFGHGNVAIDVARILLSPIDALRVNIEGLKHFVHFLRILNILSLDTLLKLDVNLCWLPCVSEIDCIYSLFFIF